MGKHLEQLYIKRAELEIEMIRLKEFLNSQAILPEQFRKIDSKQFTLITDHINAMEYEYNAITHRIKYDEEKKKNARK